MCASTRLVCNGQQVHEVGTTCRRNTRQVQANCEAFSSSTQQEQEWRDVSRFSNLIRQHQEIRTKSFFVFYEQISIAGLPQGQESQEKQKKSQK